MARRILISIVMYEQQIAMSVLVLQSVHLILHKVLWWLCRCGGLHIFLFLCHEVMFHVVLCKHMVHNARIVHVVLRKGPRHSAKLQEAANQPN